MWRALAFEATRVAQRRKGRSSNSTDLSGTAALFAYTGIVAVPVLVALNPAWLRRWTVPMLAVTSIGVYYTVPDTERVRTVMFVVVPIACVCALVRVKVPALVAAAVAVVILWQAIQDAHGAAPPIIRSIGCFAALLAMPVAALLTRLAKRGRPATLVVLVTHGAVAVFASRAFVREKSVGLLVVAIGAALLVAVVVLFVASREPDLDDAADPEP